MATAYAVNSRLLRGFCASGPKSIAHKRSFGKSPAPAEGRFPGVFFRSGRRTARRQGPQDKDILHRGQRTASEGRARQAHPGGHPGQDGGHPDEDTGRDLHPPIPSHGPTPAIPTEKRIRPARMWAPACPLRPGPVASAGPTGYSAAMCAKIARQRADQLVFMQGLAASREQARRLIMAGKVALSSEGLPPAPAPKGGQAWASLSSEARSSSCWGRSASSVAAPTRC